MTRQIKSIIIHCSNMPNGEHASIEKIDTWHRERSIHHSADFRQRQNPDLTSIGYHFIIYPNGAVATGRQFDELGAHAQGFNSKSIGICLVGTDKFTRALLEQNVCGLVTDIVLLQGTKNPKMPSVLGHRDLPDVRKECPGFFVAEWRTHQMRPLPGHILDEGVSDAW